MTVLTMGPDTHGFWRPLLDFPGVHEIPEPLVQFLDPMPHFCRHCRRYRPNEKFSGSGHKRHLCRDCVRLPSLIVREADELRELEGFLQRQSHVSARNVKRLVELKASESDKVRRLAAIVEEIAYLYPFKRGRIRKLARTHPKLLRACVEAGLLDTWLMMDVRDENDSGAVVDRATLAEDADGTESCCEDQLGIDEAVPFSDEESPF